MNEELAKLLGVKETLSTELDWARLVEKGLPTKGLDRIKVRLDLSDLELSDALLVSKKTLYRLKNRKKARLDVGVSDRLARLGRIVVLAESVLEDTEAALEWLRTEQVGLGGEVPLDLIRTDAGAREVERLLGRIDYGVLS